MYPQLSSDTFFIPVSEGIFIRNNKNSFALKGTGLAAWLKRLEPLLDGQHDLADLSQALPVEKRPHLHQLVHLLMQQGCIKDASLDHPHTLSPELLNTYAPAITFIDYHQNSPAYRFQQFLSTPVLGIASGEPLLALAHALLETGNRAITLIDTGEMPTNYVRLQEILTVLQDERDAELDLCIIKTADWENPSFQSSSYQDQLKAICSSARMVLYANTTPSSAHYADILASICQQAQVAFLPVVALHNALHVGPLYQPKQVGCWQCYWRRVQSAYGLPAYEKGKICLTPEATQVPDLAKSALGIVANILALEFFKYATDITYRTLAEQVYILELQRLQNARHQLFPHPLCTVCTAQERKRHNEAAIQISQQIVRDEIACMQKFQRTNATTGTVLLKITEKWADQNSGLVTTIDDRDYQQLPLVRVQVHTTLAAENTYTHPIIVADGLDYAEVRLSAIQKAMACYLESLTPENRTLYGSVKQLRPQYNLIPPEQFFGWQHQGLADIEELVWTWAADLAHLETLLLVPGAAVAPRSNWNRTATSSLRLFTHETGGTGLGEDWSEALAYALQSLCSSIVQTTLTEHLHLPAARPVAQNAYNDDSLCTAYLSMLEILKTPVTLLDVTDYDSTDALPAYVASVESDPQKQGKDNTLCYSAVFTHWHPLHAVRQALQAAVLRIQIAHDPASKPSEQSIWQTCSASLLERPIQKELPAALGSETDYITGSAALHAYLKSTGWRVVVTPFLQDRTVNSLLPGTLRVLAAR